ncbi:MAG: tetratricopeptide repeat protein, partial [Myxococcales bacterium]|nr:tetratricopeptide repeat protein [Myxococcales bacterium]
MAPVPPKAPPPAAPSAHQRPLSHAPSGPAALAGSAGVGLPAIAAAHADLPSVVDDADLPAIFGGLADLPSVAADLPAPAAMLPVPAASLPVVAGNLPVPFQSPPPSPGGAPRGFGEIDLPMPVDALPAVPALDRHLPARPVDPGALHSSFGEIDLPREPAAPPPRSSPSPVAEQPRTAREPSGARDPSGDFRELELEDRPRGSHGRHSARPGVGSVVSDVSRSGGGMAFGEVELSTAEGRIAPVETDTVAPAVTGIEASLPPARAPAGGPDGVAAPAATAQVHPGADAPSRAGRRREEGAAKRAVGKTAGLAAIVAAVLGGAALQLTPLGAYGYLYAQDLLYVGSYARATAATVAAADRALAPDTYDGAVAGVDLAVAAQGRTPRAKSLAAYVAFLERAVAVRFGPDTRRASRAKQLLAELPPGEGIRYRDLAAAAAAAEAGQLEKARAGLDAASKGDPADPVQVEVALLRGEVELAAKDAAGATAAFQRALRLSNDARAHFGLARAYDLAADGAAAAREIEATLAASPAHVGALTLRARRNSAPTDEGQAMKDLSEVLEGPARAKAAPSELSRAYAARAWLSLERGSPSEAREGFAQAVKLDPQNIGALRGEGRQLLVEGRYTEALARFETALRLDPGSPDAIADDAEAKLDLDRLADAKQELTEARQRFPRSAAVVQLLGRVEQHLGNSAAAEADLRAAVALVDPARRDAVQPYVALSELLAARGRLSDAKATLDDARQRLVPSAALERALGEVAELQGEYDAAIGHYRAAIARDARDVAAHFHLAVALRRIRKFDEAGAELDRVAAVDKDYPGLSLERGQLFEESGDVQKAIEQFKGALARAPDDPDLQLRVGSAYVAIGRPDDAIPMLRKVLEARPTSAEAHHFLGRALMLKGSSQQADALRYLKRAVDLDPNRAEFHVYLAWAANEATPAQLELARDEIDKALALDKLAAEAYWQKGVLERMEGAIEDAIKHEKRALELRPSRYEAHATLAECYQDRNDDGTAMAEWAKAIASDGDAKEADGSVPHPYWRYQYGKLLLERGNVAGALAHLLPAALTVEKS